MEARRVSHHVIRRIWDHLDALLIKVEHRASHVDQIFNQSVTNVRSRSCKTITLYKSASDCGRSFV